MTFTNSPLVNHTRISPHRTPNRNHVIDTVTIHCVVGQCKVEALGELFQTKQCCSNYGIGYDGRIGMYCEEKDRSWCSSSASNDHRAITIEVASDTVEPYAVRPAAYNALIKLLVDICKRNNIKQLLWKGDKSLIGQVDKQNMTVHRWFHSGKSCPGTYLYDLHPRIAAEVNKQLETTSTNTPEKSVLYRVQVGAFKEKANAVAMMENLKKAGFEGFITEVAPEKAIQVGISVKIKSGAKDYDKNESFNDYVYGWLLQVKRIDGDRVVVTHNGETTGAVNINDLIVE